MNTIARICADRRPLGWALVLLLSIPPTLGFLGFRLADEVVDGWVPQNVLAELEEVEDTFHFGAPVVLVLECDDFFQPERVTALHSAVAALRNMDEVEHLAWMGDVPAVNLRGVQRSLLPTPEESLTEERLNAARTELTQHPLCQQNLISTDGRTALILVDTSKPQHTVAIRDTAREILESTNITTRATGVMALREVEDRVLHEDNIRIQLLAYLLVGVTAFIMFRRPAAMFIAGCGPMTGLFWSMGWLMLVGQAGNELAMIILPVMVTMIGYTDGVHLVVRIRQLKATGISSRDSIFQAVQTVGPACMLTSITTAIGFGSLMISHSDMIAGFGRVSAIGVAVSFLAVVLVNPLLANTTLGDKIHIHASGDLLQRLMNRNLFFVNFSCRYAKLVALIGLLITVSCSAAAMQLTPEDRLSTRIPHDCEAAAAMRHCDAEIGGVRVVHLVIDWPDDMTRQDLWSVIRDCEQVLTDEDKIGQVASIRSALSVYSGPNSPDRSVLVNKLPDDLRERFYHKNLQTTLVAGRLRDEGIEVLEPLFARIHTRLLQLNTDYPGIKIRMVSDVIIEAQVVRQIIEELVQSLMTAALIIFGVLTIAFGSVRIGLISIIPNVMPLAIAAAIRLMISDSLGIASACSFAICLGIAVDDTIHYLNHYQRQRKLGLDPVAANRTTFLSVGSALMMTTLVMSSGLATVMISRLPPHLNFAAMGCSTLLAALPADLLVLPALLCLFPGKETNPAVAPQAISAKDSRAQSAADVAPSVG